MLIFCCALSLAPITIGESRKVESTYYPEGYPNNAHQVWTFTTEEDLKLMLYISFLLTEPNYDVLAIGSGSSCTTHSFANISGAYLDHYVLSEDNTMCIYYSSDYSVQNIGFTATVYTVTEEGKQRYVQIVCFSDCISISLLQFSTGISQSIYNITFK